MKSLPIKLLFVFISTLFLSSSCKQEPITLHIIETTDLHGRLDDNMSSIAGYIRDAKAQYGDNLLVLDCGDNFQGSADVFFSNYIDTLNEHICASLFNWLPYDALTVGNHDFEAGEAIYERAYSAIKKPILCANIVDVTTQKPIFKPYTIIRRGGYKIAILGLVSDEALSWIPEISRHNCEFHPIEESATHWMTKINKKEHPDFVIGLFHTGDEAMKQDSAIKLIRDIPGIDLICGGHDHKAEVIYPVNKDGRTICVMKAGCLAEYIAEATVVVTPNKGRKPFITTTAKIIATDTLPTCEEYNQMIKPFAERSSAYNSKVICYIDSTIYSNDALYGDCAWTTLLHQSYRMIARKMGYVNNKEIDFTLLSASIPNVVLKKGPLTIGDFFLLYPYENSMSIIEMTTPEILLYMEYVYNLRIQHPDEPIYDFDSFDGLMYTVSDAYYSDSRIIPHRLFNGGLLQENTRYRIALNNFRALGGGGHLNALGWTREKQETRIIATSDKILRAMLIELYEGDTIHISEKTQPIGNIDEIIPKENDNLIHWWFTKGLNKQP